MKAVVCTKYGPPTILKIKEVEKPVPRDNEVLIKIYATTVNRTDVALQRAKPFINRFFTGILSPNKIIMGTEFSGEITAVGSKVLSYKVGDRVFGFDDTIFGTHAQYMTIPEDKAVALIPIGTTYEEAAASSEGAYYAYNFINKVNLKKGERVLVNGAAGAIGSATVQLLKYFGANVTGVCKEKDMEIVRSLGSDRVVDYSKEDFTKGDQKYNYIFDTAGKSSFLRCRPLLQSKGIYISSELGYMSQNIFYALITPILGGKKVIFPLPAKCKETIFLMKKLIEEKKFKTVIDRKYPLEEIVAAYKYVETGEKSGNVVITVKHSKGTS